MKGRKEAKERRMWDEEEEVKGRKRKRGLETDKKGEEDKGMGWDGMGFVLQQ
jgi:hypothetical protein